MTFLPALDCKLRAADRSEYRVTPALPDPPPFATEPVASQPVEPAPVEHGTSDELEIVDQPFESPAPATIAERSALGSVVDLILKDHGRLDAYLRLEEGQRRMIPKLLAIAVGGFVLYGVVITFMLNLAHTENGFWFPGLPAAHWNGATVANLTLAYAVGMIAANGICLPSFYFYGLLSGIRVSMLGVTAHALKGMAAGAVALVGILPIYVAASLNVLIYSKDTPLVIVFVGIGLLLPFLAGMWGALSLYRGFVGLADTIPAEFRRDRTCLLRRLILAWSGCYTFVTPLVIYTLWQHLS